MFLWFCLYCGVVFILGSLFLLLVFEGFLVWESREGEFLFRFLFVFVFFEDVVIVEDVFGF